MEKLTNLFIEFLSIDCTDEIPSEDLIIESMKFNYKQFLDSLINLEERLKRLNNPKKEFCVLHCFMENWMKNKILLSNELWRNEMMNSKFTEILNIEKKLSDIFLVFGSSAWVWNKLLALNYQIIQNMRIVKSRNMQKRIGFQCAHRNRKYFQDDPIIYSFDFDCDNEENINIIVKMFKEISNNKQLHALHYFTIKYLIENSQKIKEFFEVYANTEDEEDANKSKNRLYSLIGNELGNLQIEYPILIPFGKMASNYQWNLYNKILLLEENNEEESLYLTKEELEESINAEIRINASLLLGTFQGIYDHFVEEVDDDETKELGNNIKKKFFDLIKKRIEIANCFICLYANVIKECEKTWETKEGKEQILKKQRKIVANEHLSDLRHYLENNQKDKEKLTKNFKKDEILLKQYYLNAFTLNDEKSKKINKMSADFLVWGKLIDGIVNSKNWRMKNIQNDYIKYFNDAKLLVNKYYWGFYCTILEELNEQKYYRSLKLILDKIETGKSNDGSVISVII
uniref:Nuclear pore complex protein n=1 Tax=Meloidogyne floridensis TaxID=298350 RepID=A0A915NRQ8_9BILA